MCGVGDTLPEIHRPSEDAECDPSPRQVTGKRQTVRASTDDRNIGSTHPMAPLPSFHMLSGSRLAFRPSSRAMAAMPRRSSESA